MTSPKSWWAQVSVDRSNDAILDKNVASLRASFVWGSRRSKSLSQMFPPSNAVALWLCAKENRYEIPIRNHFLTSLYEVVYFKASTVLDEHFSLTALHVSRVRTLQAACYLRLLLSHRRRSVVEHSVHCQCAVRQFCAVHRSVSNIAAFVWRKHIATESSPYPSRSTTRHSITHRACSK